MNGLLLFPELFALGGIQKFSITFLEVLQSEFIQSRFTVLSLLDTRAMVTKGWDNVSILYCGGLFCKNVIYALRAIKNAIILRPNIIVCGHVNFAMLGLVISWLLRCKFIVITYGIDVWYLRKGLRLYALKNANSIITISSYTREVLIKKGIPGEKITILNNCVNNRDFYPIQKDAILADKLSLNNKKVILTVGRILDGKRKGYNRILNVLSRLGQEYVWVLVGRGKGLGYLRGRAAELKISNRVRFCSSVDSNELIKYYNLCDVFVLLSDDEGFGFVFLEAMACGRPVIASSKGGSREPLLDGRLGFLVDPEDQEKVASLIELACKAREDRTNPEFLRKSVEDNFGMAVFRKKVNEIFSKIL